MPSATHAIHASLGRFRCFILASAGIASSLLADSPAAAEERTPPAPAQTETPAAAPTPGDPDSDAKLDPTPTASAPHSTSPPPPTVAPVPLSSPRQYSLGPSSQYAPTAPPFDWLAASGGISLGLGASFALNGALALGAAGGPEYCGGSGCLQRPDYASINAGATALGAGAGFALVGSISLLGGLMDAPGPGETRRSQPMMIAGLILTSLSAASVGVTIAQAQTVDPIGPTFGTAWPFLLTSIVTGAVGIPLMVAGANVDTPGDREDLRLAAREEAARQEREQAEREAEQARRERAELRLGGIDCPPGYVCVPVDGEVPVWTTTGAYTLGPDHDAFRFGLEGGFPELLSFYHFIGLDFRYFHGIGESFDLSFGAKLDFTFSPLPVPTPLVVGARGKVLDTEDVALAVGLETDVTIYYFLPLWTVTPALLFSYRFAEHWTLDLGALVRFAVTSENLSDAPFLVQPGGRIGTSFFSSGNAGFFAYIDAEANITPDQVYEFPRVWFGVGPQWRW